MILGHQKQFQYLKTLLSSKKLPHAFLFVGPERIGKKTVALEFAKLILGNELKGHPDFLMIDKEKEISISEIKEFCWHFSLKPFNSEYKVGIINNAHLMTEEAQNCFLKTLEEPKTKTVFILITSFLSLLFPTIVSRCQLIKFYPLKKAELENFLKENSNLTESQREKIIAISQGRTGIVFDLMSHPEKIQKWERAKEMILKFQSLSFQKRFEIAEKLAKEKNPKDVFENWLYLLHEIFLENVFKASKQFSLEKLLLILNTCHTVFYLSLRTKVNPRSLFEFFLLKF